jgi:hypothetical protein
MDSEHRDHIKIYNQWTRMDLSVAINAMAGFLLMFASYQHMLQYRTEVLQEINRYNSNKDSNSTPNVNKLCQNKNYQDTLGVCNLNMVYGTLIKIVNEAHPSSEIIRITVALTTVGSLVCLCLRYKSFAEWNIKYDQDRRTVLYYRYKEVTSSEVDKYQP